MSAIRWVVTTSPELESVHGPVRHVRTKRVLRVVEEGNVLEFHKNEEA